MKATAASKTREATQLMQEGFSTREVATRLNISPATVARIHANNKENIPVNKGGRPRKLGSEAVEHIKLNLKRGALKTAKEAHATANELLPEPVSYTIIRRRLREAGLIAKKI
ncbi:hypothetical protein BGZ70_005056, partial [Mortierella alpina]